MSETMARRGNEFIRWAVVQADGDPDIGTKPYNQKITVGVLVEDAQDREQFRTDLQTAYSTILGSDCRVIFSGEQDGSVSTGEETLNWGSEDEHEPGIG